MENLLRLGLLVLIICTQSCISIPNIQEGGYVDKINNTNIQLVDGEKLKMVRKKSTEKTTIILVRHAEKMKDTKDPFLTEEGKERAKKLSRLLSDTKVDFIYSTDYNRTQSTALPTAMSKNLEVQLYDPRTLIGFSKLLLERHKGKTSLVVGHSNTTHKIMNYYMRKEVVKSIDESDYENLFIVNVLENDDNRAVLLKF